MSSTGMFLIFRLHHNVFYLIRFDYPFHFNTFSIRFKYSFDSTYFRFDHPFHLNILISCLTFQLDGPFKSYPFTMVTLSILISLLFDYPFYLIVLLIRPSLRPLNPFTFDKYFIKYSIRFLHKIYLMLMSI